MDHGYAQVPHVRGLGHRETWFSRFRGVAGDYQGAVSRGTDRRGAAAQLASIVVSTNVRL